MRVDGHRVVVILERVLARDDLDLERLVLRDLGV